MITVTSAEFQHHCGHYQDLALTEPVAIIIRNGRERVVILSAEEYQRLKRLDRQVLALDEFTAADLEAIRHAEPPPEAAEFDFELDK